jgi:hypothetical protein
MIKDSTLGRLCRTAESPTLNLLAGAILLVTGLLESFATMFEGLFGFQIGAHHGIAIFGFLQLLKAFPDTFKGLKLVEEGEKSLARTASVGAWRE